MSCCDKCWSEIYPQCECAFNKLQDDRACLLKLVKAADLLIKGKDIEILWNIVFKAYSEDIEELK